MLPIRLKLHNFLAYRDPGIVNFEGIQIACLSGANGAGKSSLLDAITWALWGRSRVPGNRNDDELIHMGQTEMSVILDFRHEQAIYRVVRKYTRKGQRSQGALEFYRLDDEGAPHLINEGTAIRETQAQITRLLRLDYETFIHSAFVQQGKADAFTMRTPAERKKILAEILGLARWQGYEDQVKQRLQSLETEMSVIAASIIDKEREEAKEPALIQELAVSTQQAEQAKTALDAARVLYEEVADAPTEYKAHQEQLAATQRRLKDRQHDLAAIDKEAAEQQRRLQTFQQIIADQETIEAGYERLESARQTDFDLGDKLKQLSDLQAHLADLRRQLDTECADLEQQASLHRDRMRQADMEIAAIQNVEAELAEVDAALIRLDQRRAERDETQTQQAALGTESTEIKADNKALRRQMDDIKQRLTILDAADGAACPVCGQPLDADHRSTLDDQYQLEGKQRGDAFRANNNRLKEIEALIAAHDDLIRQTDLELRGYDKLKGRQGALAERKNKAQQAIERFEQAQAELSAIETQLQSGHFSLELRAQIDDLQAQIDGLGYDRAAHNEARDALKTLYNYETRKRDLQIALNSVVTVESSLIAIQERRERCLIQLNEEQTAETDLKAALEILKLRVSEAQRRKADMMRFQSLEREANEKRVSAEQRLKAVHDARLRKLELLMQRDQLHEEELIHQQLQQAFGKNGIPAMIIDAAIPELEATANRLLTRLTDGQMSVRFDTQREKKSGGTIETLDILIADELGTRSYDMFSGGEGFRVNFALRIALSQFLARRAGARLQTLVIDEGFGSQDVIGRERLVDAINTIRSDFDLILIVSHLEDLIEAFSTTIEIQKTPDGSTITIR